MPYAKPRKARAPSRRFEPLPGRPPPRRSEEHTSELQSQSNLVCRLLLEKKKKNRKLATSSYYSRRSVNSLHTISQPFPYLSCILVNTAFLITSHNPSSPEILISHDVECE